MYAIRSYDGTEAQMNLRQSVRPAQILARRPDGVADDLGVATFRP